MAEGLMFYWLSWVLWIIVTFFMKKNKNRLFYATWVLLSIGFSTVYLTFMDYEISLLLLILILGAVLLFIPLFSNLIYLYIPFIIMVGFTAMLLLEQGMPVWFFLPRKYFIPLLCSLLILFLIKGIYKQLISGILGITSGELVYSLILSSYGFKKTIGDPMFFDYIIITIVLIVCFNSILTFRTKLISSAPFFKQ